MLFLASFFFASSFSDLSLSQFHDQKFSFQFTDMKEQLDGYFIFAIAFAIIPLFHFGLIQFGTLKKISHSLIAILIMLSSGVLFWLLRINFVQGLFSDDFNMDLPAYIQISAPYSATQFEWYFFCGVVSGALISWIVLFYIKKRRSIQ